MLEWLMLFIVIACYFCSCTLSYNQDFRRSNYYMPTAIGIGLICSIIWNSMVKYIDDKNKIYFYSLIWDISTIFIYYLYPILLLNIKLEKWGILGIFMIVCGLIIVKLNMVSE